MTLNQQGYQDNTQYSQAVRRKLDCFSLGPNFWLLTSTFMSASINPAFGIVLDATPAVLGIGPPTSNDFLHLSISSQASH